MTPQEEFISMIAAAAVASMRTSQVPASFTIAEAALETGWGKHIPPGHNLFGVKADASWIGPVTVQRTWEVVNGQRERIEARFRAYPDWQGSMNDHAAFLHENERYSAAFQCTNGEDFAKAIAAAHYATDPEYATKLIEIMHAHDLDQYDQA